MEIAEIIEAFGVDPDETGNRPRGWWIIEAQEQIEDEEESAGCQVGDLVVRS
jgi:hypothetical protein